MSAHLFSSLGVKYPIIQAPMAGGPSSPSLVSSVSNAGGVGFLASGYLSASALEAQILAVQKLTDKPFGVNIFLTDVVPPTVVQKSPEILELEGAIGLPKKDPAVTVAVDEQIDQKISLVVKYGVKIVSFTFGVPTSEQLNILDSNNVLTIGTACNITEALILQKIGVKAVVLQGIEAGGHRGSFSTSQSDEIALLPLLQAAQVKLSIPYIASGGISTGRAILAAKVLGANAVQIGTAFILTHESGSSNATKQALLAAKPEDTLLTASISGKKARGVNNSLIQGLQNSHIEPYPIQNALTKELRGHAFKNSLTEYQNLWSGQGVDLVKEQSAGELIRNLVAEYQSAVKQDYELVFGL